MTHEKLNLIVSRYGTPVVARASEFSNGDTVTVQITFREAHERRKGRRNANSVTLAKQPQVKSDQQVGHHCSMQSHRHIRREKKKAINGGLPLPGLAADF
jgi:hypothetical protein